MIADPLLVGVMVAVLFTHLIAFAFGWILGESRCERAHDDFVGECVWPTATSEGCESKDSLFHNGTFKR